jgi:hypothetical protein
MWSSWLDLSISVGDRLIAATTKAPACYEHHHHVASAQRATSTKQLFTNMSSSHAPTSPPTEEDTARTIVYDPSDPFWRDTEDDDDDMDFVPARESTDDNEEGEGDLSFHGTYCSDMHGSQVTY